MILLILHGPNFWKWVIVPGVIYLLERMVRFLRSRTGQGRTYISSGILLPSKVTHLVREKSCNTPLRRLSLQLDALHGAQ